jgi:hypothetical protein
LRIRRGVGFDGIRRRCCEEKICGKRDTLHGDDGQGKRSVKKIRWWVQKDETSGPSSKDRHLANVNSETNLTHHSAKPTLDR